MAVLDVALNWIHVLCAVVFLGAMFLATFVLMPTVKAYLDEEHRHRLMVHFIPRVRSIMRVVVLLLVLSGISRAVLLHFTHEGPASAERLGVFGLKILFAAIPIVIFILAPKILGGRSKEGLCCDPDAEGPTIKVGGVMTSLGESLHYAAIAGGWLAILFAIILNHMR